MRRRGPVPRVATAPERSGVDPAAGAATDVSPPLDALRIGLVHNPLSGNNRRGRHPLAALAGRAGIEFREATEPASIAQALRELAAREVNTVAISGGDGTVSAALNSLLEASPFSTMPWLALLRGGTANMTAGDVGLRGPQDRALARLIEAAARGGADLAAVARPALRVDPGAGRERYSGFFVGAAAIAQGIEYCKRHMHTIGLRAEVGPGVTLARFVVAMARGERDIVAPVPMRIGFDGEAAAGFDCALLCVTTLRRLVLGLHPFWGGEPAPLRCTAVRAAPRHWIRALPGLLRGHPGRHTTAANGYMSRNAHRIALGLETHAYVDGEIVEPSPGTPLLLSATAPIRFLVLR